MPYFDDCGCNYGHFDPLFSTLGVGPKGDKGDTFTFDDLTDQQIAQIKGDIVSAYYRKREATYRTIGTTSFIPVPFQEWNDHDMIFVDINGLDLVDGVDYVLQNGNVVLSSPISDGADVNFKLLRAIAITADDYDALKGEMGDSGDYATLANKPSINNVQLNGNVSLQTIGINTITNGEIDRLFQ